MWAISTAITIKHQLMLFFVQSAWSVNLLSHLPPIPVLMIAAMAILLSYDGMRSIEIDESSTTKLL